VTELAAPKWLVQRCGLAPLAARAGVQGLKADLARSAIAWAKVEQDLPPVVATLRSKGIRVAPIKGSHYAKALYANPAERPMADVDLLVMPQHRGEAERALREIGFEAFEAAPLIHHASVWSRGELTIDLHWNIVADGRSRIDFAQVWSRMTPGWPAGAEFLERTDALVFHLVHLVRNRLRAPLLHVVDTARMLEHVPPTAARERAARWGIIAGVNIALRFCEEILAGDADQPAGSWGPRLSDVRLLQEPTSREKFAFEIISAGSFRQLAARAVHAGANIVNRRLSRQK